jgi:Protein of unknown function (DUF3891)
VAKGRPYAHREEIPAFEPVELRAYARNVEWVGSQDRYAGLLVSMHRTGLWQNRYDTFTSPKGRLRERSPEVKAVKQQLENQQQEEKKSLGLENPTFENDLWFNYRALQIYDLLSLYFCCDGYADDDHFKEDMLAPIRLSYDSQAEVQLRIVPTGVRSVRMEPYPFDISPFTVSVRGRTIAPGNYGSQQACLEAYHKAPRRLSSFEISR